MILTCKLDRIILLFSFIGLKKHAKKLVSILFPILCKHFCGSKFQHPSLIWKVFCRQMAYLILKMRVTRANFHHLLKQTRDSFVTIMRWRCWHLPHLVFPFPLHFFRSEKDTLKLSQMASEGITYMEWGRQMPHVSGLDATSDTLRW